MTEYGGHTVAVPMTQQQARERLATILWEIFEPDQPLSSLGEGVAAVLADPRLVAEAMTDEQVTEMVRAKEVTGESYHDEFGEASMRGYDGDD